MEFTIRYLNTDKIGIKIDGTFSLDKSISDKSRPDYEDYLFILFDQTQRKYGHKCQNIIVPTLVGVNHYSIITPTFLAIDMGGSNYGNLIIINREKLKSNALVIYCDEEIIGQVVGKGGRHLRDYRNRILDIAKSEHVEFNPDIKIVVNPYKIETN